MCHRGLVLGIYYPGGRIRACGQARCWCLLVGCLGPWCPPVQCSLPASVLSHGCCWLRASVGACLGARVRPVPCVSRCGVADVLWGLGSLVSGVPPCAVGLAPGFPSARAPGRHPVPSARQRSVRLPGAILVLRAPRRPVAVPCAAGAGEPWFWPVAHDAQLCLELFYG